MSEKEIHAESMFIDSGAHSIFNIHVLKLGERIGEHGRKLDKPPVRWSQGDFSYFDLTKGSPFRKYCDSYAALMKKLEGRKVTFANVDAISNPDLTWEIQRFFEEEHGVCPVPIVHYGTPMKYVDRYLQAVDYDEFGEVSGPKYDILGVGGLGQGVSRHEYFSWADKFFTHICPESNGRLPLIKAHGFAMTSWELMCRYPWWSVDSATWVKLSAYGWLYIPRWSEDVGWDFNRPPMNINFSWRSPRLEERQKHFTNVPKRAQEVAARWLKHLGLEMGSVDEEGKTKVFGVTSHHRARSIANLSYLLDLQDSRPEWPYQLDNAIVEGRAVKYQQGFGL